MARGLCPLAIHLKCPPPPGERLVCLVGDTPLSVTIWQQFKGDVVAAFFSASSYGIFFMLVGVHGPLQESELFTSIVILHLYISAIMWLFFLSHMKDFNAYCLYCE